MKVFISWSGERSKAVAEALRDWIPNVTQNAKPWVSSHDISKGSRWGPELAKELEETRFGIICLTPENIAAPWLLFETGALSKTLEGTFVCPFLLGLNPADIEPPFAQFQITKAERDDTLKLMRSLNDALRKESREETQTDLSLPDNRLETVFDRWWPDLEETLKNLPPTQDSIPPKRPQNEKIDEILELVRGIAGELGHNSGLFRGLFEAAKIGIAVLDLQTGYLITANSAYSLMLGYSEVHLLTYELHEFIHDEDRLLFDEALKELLSGKSILGLQLRYKRIDGSFIPVRFISLDPFSPSRGNAFCVLVVQPLSDYTAFSSTET